MKQLSKENILRNTIKLKNVINDSTVDTVHFIKEKTIYFQEIMRNTILSIQKYKYHEIFSNSDVVTAIQIINELYEKTENILIQLQNVNNKSSEHIENLITLLQNIIDKLSIILCGLGTMYFDDLLYICIGSHYKNILYENTELCDKIALIRKYVHPIGYKSISSKLAEKTNIVLCSNKITEEIIHIEKSSSYECYDVETNTQIKPNFFNKVYGIRIVLQEEKTQKALIINGIVDDILIKCITSKYIDKRKHDILNTLPEGSSIDISILTRIIDTMTLKDFLVFGTEDIHKKYWMMVKDVSMVKQNRIDYVIKKFIEMDIFSQRTFLLNLLAYNIDDEVQYITYLLYDIITAPNVGGNGATGQNYVVGDSVDTKDQMLIYDSFPWVAKMQFKDVMKLTVKYTQDMIQKYDINRVSIEQQIYLMKVQDYIKEKAMIKLKEIKGKGDDASSKAKQYLEGLLKIPFGVYKEEPILKRVKDCNSNFVQILCKVVEHIASTIPKKPKYTNIEIIKYSKHILQENNTYIDKLVIETLETIPTKLLIEIVKYIQTTITNNRLVYSISPKKTKEKCKKNIQEFLHTYPKYKLEICDIMENVKLSPIIQVNKDIMKICDSVKQVETDLQSITDTLDKSIHGHDYAKNQILKIIGQWMNGEQSGYCFGFEGSPGVGKTSVAKKGLANCLVDENGQSRPFAFIALGGSCNGSTLEGHSYTYVNSIWGRITDILMESKCMNPIIYIDELDKVSKTEHGKEIIGILTHLIDTTQNDSFQDKYYSGINLDLSKALFIFSYNDPENIDRILLDRIHRVKFNNLTLDDKLVIVKNYILKDINDKMGFHDTVILSDSIIEYIIETYTMEPGVRKLKEVLFDLYGEINLELLKSVDDTREIPITITIDDLDTKYLKKYHKMNETKIPCKSEIGIINGLWANALGKGGIIPIETMFYPSSSFLELRLTGLQGDVMKESMNVAKSLAWNVTPLARKKELQRHFDETKCQGLHIHCPEGAVSKDGPSAGTAITIAIYSLLNDRKIKNTLAITGEINLQGQVTAIGGLESKIMGGIRAGVKTFLYPEKNQRDYDDFMEKYSEKPFVKDIEFIAINNIEQGLKYALE